MSRRKKCFSGTTTSFLIERDLFGKPFESAWQENYLLYVYPGFTSEISLVSLALCMTGSHRLGAADKNCILITLSSRS